MTLFWFLYSSHRGFRRPTGDGVQLPKILLRNGTDVEVCPRAKICLVGDFKLGLDIHLDIHGVCLVQCIFGLAVPPFPDLHRVVGELYLLLFFASPVCISLFK